MEMNTMKNLTAKFLTLGLTAAMLTTCLTACKTNKSESQAAAGQNQTRQEQEADPDMKNNVGSWAVPESSEVTEEHKKIFENMVSQLDGFYYEPVAFLGSQVVAGKNYCFLGKPTLKSNGGLKSFTLIYIYVDLQGKASLLANDRLVLPGTENAGKEEPVPGGWSYAESAEITDKIKQVMDKATETLTGATYEPVAYIGSQVVSGTNHAIFCKATPSVKELNGASKWVLVYVYENLEGKCEITKAEDVQIAVK